MQVTHNRMDDCEEEIATLRRAMTCLADQMNQVQELSTEVQQKQSSIMDGFRNMTFDTNEMAESHENQVEKVETNREHLRVLHASLGAILTPIRGISTPFYRHVVPF